MYHARGCPSNEAGPQEAPRDAARVSEIDSTLLPESRATPQSCAQDLQSQASAEAAQKLAEPEMLRSAAKEGDAALERMAALEAEVIQLRESTARTERQLGQALAAGQAGRTSASLLHA